MQLLSEIILDVFQCMTYESIIRCALAHSKCYRAFTAKTSQLPSRRFNVLYPKGVRFGCMAYLDDNDVLEESVLRRFLKDMAFRGQHEGRRLFDLNWCFSSVQRSRVYEAKIMVREFARNGGQILLVVCSDDDMSLLTRDATDPSCGLSLMRYAERFLRLPTLAVNTSTISFIVENEAVDDEWEDLSPGADALDLIIEKAKAILGIETAPKLPHDAGENEFPVEAVTWE